MSMGERFERTCRDSWEGQPFMPTWDLVDEDTKTKYRAMVRRVLRAAQNILEGP